MNKKKRGKLIRDLMFPNSAQELLKVHKAMEEHMSKICNESNYHTGIDSIKVVCADSGTATKGDNTNVN